MIKSDFRPIQTILLPFPYDQSSRLALDHFYQPFLLELAMLLSLLFRITLLGPVFVAMIINCSLGQSQERLDWQNFSHTDRVRSGITLGGIGTGGIELRKDGMFHNWTIFNNYPFGTGPLFQLPVRPGSGDQESFLFFAVKYQLKGQQPKIKLLHLTESFPEGGLINENPIYYFPWLSAVDHISYAGQFPKVHMKFSSEDMPFDVSLEAFSPFIPHDVKNSSLPGIYFDFKVESKTDQPVEIMFIGTLRNLVAFDKLDKYFVSAIKEEDRYKYFTHSVGNVPGEHVTNGQMSFGAKGGDEVTYHLGWAHRHPYYENLLVNNRFANFDDTENRNKATPSGGKIGFMGEDNNQVCKSSIAVSKMLNPGSSITAEFFMNWYFPNAYGAIVQKDRKKYEPIPNEKGYDLFLKPTERVGHYYENHFNNIDELVQYFLSAEATLKHKTGAFLNDFYSTTEEKYILDQVNSHLNTFITSSQLDKRGRFGIREGMTSNQSWGPYITTDVSLYGSIPILSLFPGLQQSSMRAHRALQTHDGEINHGLGFDLSKNQNGTFGVFERVDLVPNYIQLVLRDYFWTNDQEYLKELWPSIKLGIEYMLSERDKNGDQMPDMEGIMCSYDNFPMYGLASYIQSQWITTMTMAAKAAKDMEEPKTAREYQKMAKKAADLMEKKLWNGEYYRLYNDYDGEQGVSEGCLTDQMMGQWVAKTAGLGYILDSTRIRSAMKNILSYSFIEEKYLRNCTWPEHPTLFPMHDTHLWVDQANTPWTGVELAFASFLIQEGLLDEGKAIIKAVDERYKKAGLYWDHQEFGGHYYRPMSSWAILHALSGFTLVKDGYSFDPKAGNEEFTYFFSANLGTGLFNRKDDHITIHAQSGKLAMASLSLPSNYWKERKALYVNGEKVEGIQWKTGKNRITALFEKKVMLNEGDKLSTNSRVTLTTFKK